ncbi:LacI family DNA-binding transcriptional regulator [Ciceribacter sp. RN22]|uniref:LacI family DNA-binding transcriptional regulator n=1 Tax=Ciceribacter sp. RN22 TaxID=2954932 RepID=UPI002093D85B|nr:LacI family DNA-binding transcriptional regulator [Ciceribacter sp. RN22]MCO6180758.1 LacI family DNA-binding transcriptional regulator [Ciceribacter sp. RN22]
MHKIPSQREIAKRVGTSLKTVSRVINGDPRVKAETRARIEAIASEMEYAPSQAARMMRSQKSDVIGFLADGFITATSSIELIRGAQDAAWDRGKQMMLFNIDHHESCCAARAESQLLAFRAEAVIYATVAHQEVTIPQRAVPHVLLNCYDSQARHPCVLPDDYQLAFDLTSMILDRGYRRPVFLNLSARNVASFLRARGFRDAGSTHDIDLSTSIQTAVTFDEDGGTRFLADQILPRLFAQSARPDLILCGQDILAMDVYAALNQMGLAVGEDVAVASFDNQAPIAHLLRPGLSTMQLPYYEMGRQAMLLAIDRPETVGPTIRVKGEFVARASF